tara:strand:+ start:2420 stop:2602 length:183 start_codon:yes stop_codon:yes gene_type:complete
MQLKYNRQQSIGSTIGYFLLKLILVILILFIGIFLIEKINFPSPNKNYQIDITNEIKKLK